MNVEEFGLIQRSGNKAMDPWPPRVMYLVLSNVIALLRRMLLQKSDHPLTLFVQMIRTLPLLHLLNVR